MTHRYITTKTLSGDTVLAEARQLVPADWTDEQLQAAVELTRQAHADLVTRPLIELSSEIGEQIGRTLTAPIVTTVEAH